MKKLLQHLLIMLAAGLLATDAQAQNWQYVGNPYIHGNSSLTTFFYFGDLEATSSGDLYLGYWMYSGDLKLARYASGAWSQLPSPGNTPANYLDIEVKGSNVYMAYSSVRKSNMYVFVTKYDGTSWTQLGDSMLLGNSGSGGWFDLVLDNNEVPTVLGVVAQHMADKQVMQYTSGSWSSMITLASSASAVFKENTGIFDSQNRLLLVTQGMVMTPTVKQYNLVTRIDGGVRSNLGDTIFVAATENKIKLDGSGTPYICFAAPLLSKAMAYKLNGSTWSFIADTIGTQGTMTNADVSSSGIVVFSTLQTAMNKSIYYYDSSKRVNMDSLNISGFGVGAMQDVVVSPTSNEVYILTLEIQATAAQDYSVMKHAIGKPTGLKQQSGNDNVKVYPNPTTGQLTIDFGTELPGSSYALYSIAGQQVHQGTGNGRLQQVDLSQQPKGMYYLKLTSDGASLTQKIILQ
jgi:hypothetical protein